MSAAPNRGRSDSSVAWVRPFASAAERSCSDNLARMIENAKRANVLKVEDWSSIRWDLRRRTRASSAGDGGLCFTIDRSTKGNLAVPFPPGYMDFVKALVCRYEARKSGGFAASNLQQVIRAASYLFGQLSPDRDDADVALITAGHFELAASKASADMKAGYRNIRSKLIFISEVLVRDSIVPVALSWKCPPASYSDRRAVAPDEDRLRSEHMPSPEVLDALADLSLRDDLDDRDLLLVRIVDLLICAGFRINEALTLPQDCLVEEAAVDDDGDQLMDRSGVPLVRMALRYWPEKLGHLEVRLKPIPTVMQPIARRALADIRRITKRHCAVASYQCSHPGRTLLGEPWDDLPLDSMLSTYELGVALQVGCGADRQPRQEIQGLANQYLRNHADTLPRTKGDRCYEVSKRDLEKHLCGRSMSGNILRAGEGVQDIADSLCIIPHRFVHRHHKAGIPGTVQLITDAMIDVFLGGLKSGTQKSIFERLGYLGPNEAPLSVDTHDFRHWLNTLAEEGGLSEMDVARWFGRANIRQNAAYQHMLQSERIRRMRKYMAEGMADGPIADAAARINDPIRRAEFITSTTASAHVTDFGICVHPWNVYPCAKHGACGGCSDLRVIKGDEQSQRRTSQRLEIVESQLAVAREAMNANEWGSDRWVATHERERDSLKRIMGVHQGALEPGTIVHMPRAESLAANQSPGARGPR